jgi:hypothetical protein
MNITEDVAKTLEKDRLVHHNLWILGGKCEIWKVMIPYRILTPNEYNPGGWLVTLTPVVDWSGGSTSGISKRRVEEWHLPEDCPR